MKKKTLYQPVEISHQSYLSSIYFYFQNAWIEIKRRYCYYLLSLLSVLIVVTATSTCQSIIDNAPLIFLKTAEGAAAERDILLYPASTSGQPRFYIKENFLNFSAVGQVLSPDYNDWMAPRSEYLSMVVSTANEKSGCSSLSGLGPED